jgi:hypothetical protein
LFAGLEADLTPREADREGGEVLGDLFGGGDPSELEVVLAHEVS